MTYSSVSYNLGQFLSLPLFCLVFGSETHYLSKASHGLTFFFDLDVFGEYRVI